MTAPANRAQYALALLACGAITLSASLASAEMVALSPSKDNTLYFDPGGATSNGAGDHLFCGNTAGDAARRALLAFDVSAVVPAGSRIESAALTLHMSKTITSGTEVGLHRVLADWGEGASNAPGEEGGGAPAMPGDATWKHRFYDSQAWATMGGEFAPVAADAAIVFGPGFYTWSSAAMVADVQSWLDDPGQSFGWLLLGDESTAATAKRFDSRENPDPEVRPVLTLVYTPIPEAESGMALAGLVGLFLLRRK